MRYRGLAPQPLYHTVKNKNWKSIRILALAFALTCAQWVNAAIGVGSTVITSSGSFIRSTASTASSSNILCTAAAGTTGTVQSGPYSGSSLTWWIVTWPSACAGYIAQTSSITEVVRFTSISPSSTSCTSAPCEKAFTLGGRGFDSVNRVSFVWSGATSGSATWNKGDSNWNGKVDVNSATSMTIQPTVAAVGDPSGTTTWTVSLRASNGTVDSRNFTASYTAPSPFSFTSLSPTSVTCSSAPCSRTFTLGGTALNTANRVTFSWTGVTSGSDVWNQGDSDWNSKVNVSSASAMTIQPTVVASGDPSGNTTWTVALRSSSGTTLSRTFAVSYNPPSLSLSAISPTNVACTSAPCSKSFNLTGTALDGVTTIAFGWSGTTSGNASWNKGDADWNSKVSNISATGMTVTPLVVGAADPAGTTSWGITLANESGATASRTFSVAYSPTPVTPSVSSISPTTLLANRGPQSLTLIGGGFSAGNVVHYMAGGTSSWSTATGAIVNSSGQISASINPGSAANTIQIRVCRSSSATSASDCSTPRSVAVVVQALVAPSPSQPSGMISTLAPTFQWSGGSGAYYLVTVRNIGTGVAYTSPQLPMGSTSWTIPPGFIVANGSYRWDIAACPVAGGGCDSGFALSTKLQFSTGSMTALSSPTPLAPSGDVAARPVFTWSAVDGAASYLIKITDRATRSLAYSAVVQGTASSWPLPAGAVAERKAYDWNIASCAAWGDQCAAPSGSRRFAVFPYVPPVATEPVAAASSQPSPNWIVVVHGWQASPAAWPDTLVRLICERLGSSYGGREIGDPAWVSRQCRSASGWRVVSYDWTEQADCPPTSLKCSRPGPWGALVNAKQLGAELGDFLVTQSPQFVHLIGHSAGSMVAHRASERLKGRARVVASFLDSFCGTAITNCSYGEHADWAEQYVDSRALLDIIGLGEDESRTEEYYGSTNWTLSSAFNFDVTDEDARNESGLTGEALAQQRHSWPYHYYINSAIGTPLTFGYPLSGAAASEAGGFDAASLIASRQSAYPANRRCEMVSATSCPLTLQSQVRRITTNIASSVADSLLRSRTPCPQGTSVPGGGLVAGSTPTVIGVCAPSPVAPTDRSPKASGQLEQASVSTEFTLSEPSHHMQFDFQFLGAGDGVFSLLVDDLLYFVGRRSTYGTAVSDSAKIDISGLLPGTHTITVIVDAYGTIPLQLSIQNLRFLRSSVAPESTDTAPDAFVFPSLDRASRAAVATSAISAITGINAPSTVSVSNGEYSIGCNGIFTTLLGEIRDGEAICVRHTTASAASTPTTTVLNVGGVTASFVSITEPDGALTVSATSLAFGGQSTLTTAPPQTVVISNAGSTTLTIEQITTTDAAFGVTHDCGTLPRILAAGAACNATVTFMPSTDGAASGILRIVTPLLATEVSLTGAGERSLVTHYYQAILQRSPDAAGKSFWESEAARLTALGVNINETWFVMAGYFFNSAEYLAANKNDTQFVTDLYNTFFNRGPDAGGLVYWVGQIQGGLPREVVLFSFMFSSEFRTFTQGIFGNTLARPEVDMVVDFFRGLLNRLPDTASFNYWLGRLRTAQCQGAGPVYQAVDDISAAFMFNPEYTNRARSNTQFVTDMYYSFLRRGGDVGGVGYWINELGSGARYPNDVRYFGFLNSPEFGARVQAVIAAGCVQ